MVYLETAQSWLEQSRLLLKARPTTTKISTKYTLLSPDSKKFKARIPKSRTNTEDASTPATLPAEPVRASLILKTYDAVSGTTLKYKTIKAAEVARLIQIVGRLARPMAGLPEIKEDVVMMDAGAAEGSGVATPVVETPAAVGGKAAGQGGVGGKKGKKKGKK